MVGELAKTLALDETFNLVASEQGTINALYQT